MNPYDPVLYIEGQAHICYPAQADGELKEDLMKKF
jgi:hypothetical protein